MIIKTNYKVINFRAVINQVLILNNIQALKLFFYYQFPGNICVVKIKSSRLPWNTHNA